MVQGLIAHRIAHHATYIAHTVGPKQGCPQEKQHKYQRSTFHGSKLFRAKGGFNLIADFVGGGRFI